MNKAETNGKRPATGFGKGKQDGYITGLTKREHIATLALAALVTANPKGMPKWVAGRAVKYADALLEELEKEEPSEDENGQEE